VYRLVTEGASVERELVRRAAGKASLARMVLQEGRGRLTAGMGSGSSALAGAGATQGEVLAGAGAGEEPGGHATEELEQLPAGGRLGIASEKVRRRTGGVVWLWLREL